MSEISKAQLIAEREIDTEHPPCGPAMSDHDWTIHIPAHSHPGFTSNNRIYEYNARIVHVGGDSEAVFLAVATHPNSAYAECNWCAIRYDGVENNG